MNSSASADPFAARRAAFPGTERHIYLDVAARGLISVGVRGAIDSYLDHRMMEGGDKAWMFSLAEESRQRFAGLIGADADEVSLTKNVSEGINAFGTALPWQAGDNVVVCQALEHPANIFPWQNLALQRGIAVKVVPPVGGRVPLDRVIAAIDARTRLVTVSSVSFAPGFRFPLAELTRQCRPRGVRVLVDAAQSVGILETDVRALDVDALAASTQKGLLGLYGSGFLYVRRDVAEDLAPIYLSRPGVRIAAEHEAAAGTPDAFAYAFGARRFDVGNFNFVGAVAVRQSIGEIGAIGTRAIEARVCGLARRLAEGLHETGLPVFGGPDCPDQAHIVAIGEHLSEEHDAVGDAFLLALNARLEAAHVRHTIRRGMLRLSLHLYNNEDDVDRVIEVARSFMASKSRRPAKVGT
ncbi:aminotransferase class V-fold PLP-dependent enzyme [Aquabacter spiritensis]|uniref:Cysteine desulfurase/selenocysteine lyase n=1 Tax=Aquabacter spiritensis TaxID=933073 RepID=A0A4R3M223_9HYPH|nr:aminotransferase class V-fold PLP-dependent enzyme [Aquabacter spiritensis]TCT06773.1 cysteine desulfurase/selenocysteine lyase [Aquabacter spiritensis]